MPAAHRHHDTCTGHGCYPSRENIEASPDVFVNGRGWHRVGDAWAAHGCVKCPPHGGSTAAGSPTVFINGHAAARVGDPVDCGSSCATGSPSVFTDER